MKKSKCLVSKHLLGHTEQWDIEKTLIKQAFAKVLLSITRGSYYNVLIYVAALFLGQVLYFNSFRQSGERQSFFGPWLFWLRIICVSAVGHIGAILVLNSYNGY